MRPVVSLVIVADYAGGEALAWEQLRDCLRALAAQDLREPVEYLLVEFAAFERHVPPGLKGILPSLRVVMSTQRSSCDLKNDGVEAASADLVVLLDADCTPGPDWLRLLVTCMRAHPDAAAVNGRLTYSGRSLLARAMTLINRSYLDHGSLRRTRHISHTNAIFRRSVLASHRLPAQGGPFGAALHAAAILDEGCQVLSDPDIKAVHSFQGWAMMRDIQRHLGYSSIRSRQLDERVPYAWTGRLGYFSLPIVAFGRTTSNLTRCLRLHRLYDVRWYELPAVLALSVFVHLLELPGMFRAVRRQPIEQTAYR